MHILCIFPTKLSYHHSNIFYDVICSFPLTIHHKYFPFQYFAKKTPIFLMSKLYSTLSINHNYAINVKGSILKGILHLKESFNFLCYLYKQWKWNSLSLWPFFLLLPTWQLVSVGWYLAFFSFFPLHGCAMIYTNRNKGRSGKRRKGTEERVFRNIINWKTN